MDLLANYKVYNKNLPTANSEVSQALTDAPAYITVQARQLANLKTKFKSGETGTIYKTIPAGSEWSSRGFVKGPKTIYLQADQDNVDVEIEEFKRQ